MAAKFSIGDRARIGGRSRRHLPAAYPWLKRGQIMTVAGIKGRTAGGHVLYQFAGRRCQPAVWLASFELRRVDDRERAVGGGRKRLEGAK